eukprot:TRINITY_DN2306_c0_g1_i1.p2 TRINITY_DN2306_c0_g1~~TRINITY_DN2306_c0_g1_i1.p2  ORF type:complete len:74 (-),score=5.59 TRINITY_DN2306_c0_g1_i1:668-889(-)
MYRLKTIPALYTKLLQLSLWAIHLIFTKYTDKSESFIPSCTRGEYFIQGITKSCKNSHGSLSIFVHWLWQHRG